MSNGGAQHWSHQFIDSSGNPYSGVKVYHTAAGTDTLKNVWTDEGKVTPAANPVVGDSRGVVSFYADGDYKFVIKDANDVILYTWDNIKITSDTATLWEGNVGTAYPSVTANNLWQQFLLKDASNNFLGLGINTGTEFVPFTPGVWSNDSDASAVANKTMILSSTVTLTANTVIPASVSIMPINPGVIVSNGYTLTINGPVVGDPRHQWLSGFAAGEILFTARGLPFKIHPIWFGMKGDFVTTGTVNNVAWGILMGALISDSAAFPVIEFEPQGLYKWTNTMLINKTCTIYWNRAVLKCEDDAGQSNTAVRLEAADIHIYDGPLVSSGSLSTNQSTNGIGLYLINADGARIYGPNISEFTSGIRIVGSSDAIIDVAIYNPIIANCTTLFSCDASGAGSSFNNINVFGGYIHNPNLVAYNITNARNVQLDGSSASATCDGVNFYGTVIEASNINSGTKCELIDVHNCSFNNIYWDNTSVITAGKDIHVLLSCSNISFIGGANLGNQKITNGCTSLIVVDPTKGIVCSGGRRLADSSGATDEHTGYMQKWILQDDNLGDDVTKNLPDATNGILLIHAGVEGGVLLVKSDGTITIVSGTANLVNTDTDTKLCVYTNATRAIIKNRLGSSIIIRAEYTYL